MPDLGYLDGEGPALGESEAMRWLGVAAQQDHERDHEQDVLDVVPVLTAVADHDVVPPLRKPQRLGLGHGKLWGAVGGGYVEAG